MDIQSIMQYITDPQSRGNPKWMTEYSEAAKAPWTKTTLSPQKEEEFGKWLQGLDWYKNIAQKEPNNKNLLNDIAGKNSDYDYRKAFQSGITPQAYEFDSVQHWPSSTPSGEVLKSPTHPTAWMEYFMRENKSDPNEFGLSTVEDAVNWHKKNAPVVDSKNAMRGLIERIYGQ